MTYVIIGNGVASIGAIEGIRRHDKDGRIVVIGAEDTAAYGRPLISYLLAGKIGPERLALRGEEYYVRNGVELKLGTTVTSIDTTKKTVTTDKGETVKYDRLLIATGGIPFVPPIPGAGLPHVVGAWDVLTGRVRTGKRVAIIGGGAVGVETALYLAEKGTLPADALKFLFINRAEPVEDLYRLSTIGTKEVVIVEMLEHVGPDIGKSTRWGMMQDMHRHRVRIKTNTRAKEITPAGVIAETADGMQEIPADTIVLALGSRSYNPLGELCKTKGIPCKVVGDARQIGKAFDAIHEGHNVACGL